MRPSTNLWLFTAELEDEQGDTEGVYIATSTLADAIALFHAATSARCTIKCIHQIGRVIL